MTPHVAYLRPSERAAVAGLLRRVLGGDLPVLRAVLFGSKARGDDDPGSDVDVLLVCDLHPDDREPACRVALRAARDVTRRTGVEVEPWVVPAADLLRGKRTPMLIDAFEDGIPLWPRGAPPLRLDFTPEDAVFCADCLLDWVRTGGPLVRDALAAGRLADAAKRSRDDITRLATAALLLLGDTRHRRRSTLIRFHQRFVGTGIVPSSITPALAWAARAYPGDGGRGAEHPPPTGRAVATAAQGYRHAGALQDAALPWIVASMDRLAATSRSWAPPPTAPPPPTEGRPRRSGRSPGAAP